MALKVSIFQFDIQWLDAQANILLIKEHLEAINDEVDLVILPEMYLSGFCMDPNLSSVKEDSKEIGQLIDLAKIHNVALIGSLAIEENGKYYNRVHLISKDGIIGRYDKQKLFSLSGENEVFDSKYDANLINFKGWNILPQVCYDLRFPEVVRSLPAPDILIYMANWPKPRIHHWDALLKARAIENQCVLIGCNRLGADGNDWEYPGHSKIVMPDGVVLETSQDPKNNVYSISLTKVKEYRAKYPFLEDKQS